MSQPNERELSDLARALGGLRPSSAGLDRDRLLYEAGRASALRRRRRWLWPASTGAMTAVAACLALVLALRPDPLPVIRIVERPMAPPDMEIAPLPIAPEVAVVTDDGPRPFSHWQMREELLRRDLTDLPVAIPEPPAAGSPAPAPPVAAWDWRTRSAVVSSLIESE